MESNWQIAGGFQHFCTPPCCNRPFQAFPFRLMGLLEVEVPAIKLTTEQIAGESQQIDPATEPPAKRFRIEKSTTEQIAGADTDAMMEQIAGEFQTLEQDADAMNLDEVD